MTDPRLVLHLDHPERRPELLDQVVLLVVERRSAEARDAEAAAHALPLALPLPALQARLDHFVGDHLQGGVEVEVLPLAAMGLAVEHLMLAGFAGGQLQRRRALGTEPPAADGRIGVALDLHDLPVLDVDVLGASDRAVGADRLDHLVRARGAVAQVGGPSRLDGRTAREGVAALQLAQQRPFAHRVSHTPSHPTRWALARKLERPPRSLNPR